jgi:threonine synthase
MFRKLALLVALSFASSTSAEEPFNVAVPVDKLAFIITQLYGPDGLIVDSLTVLPSGDTHSAHFNSAFQTEFTQFSTALTSQLATVPLPSPASGFTYEFDPTLGVFTRTTQSFGPILAERWETIGSKRFSFGFTFQQFRFDTIEGLDLDSVPAVFTHDGFQLGGGRGDLVTTVNSITATVNQFTTFLTYGITDRLDISVAFPMVSNDLSVISNATIQRIGTDNPEVHFFRDTDGELGQQRVFTAFGSASGLGDITLRLKAALARGSANGLSLGLDLRVPTGDEQDLLGSGAAGARPFLIWSRSSQAFSPHINVGYLWNGSSSLAGDPVTGEAADLDLCRRGRVWTGLETYFHPGSCRSIHHRRHPAESGRVCRSGWHVGLPQSGLRRSFLQRAQRRHRIQSERGGKPADRLQRLLQAGRQWSAGQGHPTRWDRVHLLGSRQNESALSDFPVRIGGMSSIWPGIIARYRDWLDLPREASPVTLLEGNTPLTLLPHLTSELGAKAVYLKYEGLNPTGSFKDRGMTVAITDAVHRGAKAVICASTGNTAASAAAYASRAGLRCLVLVPEGKVAVGKLAGALAHRAKVVQVQGSFDDALALVRAASEQMPVALVNSLNPSRLEGQKTVAFEILHVLETSPDWLALPVGNAGNITAVWKGFCQHHDLHHTGRPTLLGVQAEGAAPLVLGRPIDQPQTVATAIRIGRPARAEEALAAANESGGRIIATSDEDILAAQERLASEGIWVEPASAAGVAGLIQEVVSGRISVAGKTVVCIATGHGLKDPGIITDRSPQLPTIRAELTALEKIVKA